MPGNNPGRRFPGGKVPVKDKSQPIGQGDIFLANTIRGYDGMEEDCKNLGSVGPV